jgi:hypothetical protein
MPKGNEEDKEGSTSKADASPGEQYDAELEVDHATRDFLLHCESMVALALPT